MLEWDANEWRRIADDDALLVGGGQMGAVKLATQGQPRNGLIGQ
jgi:hypothetical protein